MAAINSSAEEDRAGKSGRFGDLGEQERKAPALDHGRRPREGVTGELRLQRDFVGVEQPTMNYIVWIFIETPVSPSIPG
jgi:hypothetical protein